MPPAPTPAAPTITDPNADRRDISGNLLSDDAKNAPTTASPLIVTSGASRSRYNDNVNALNTTKTNLSASADSKQNYNFVGADGKLQTINAGSPEEALSGAQGADPHSGVITPTIDKTQPAPQDGSGAAPEAPGNTTTEAGTQDADGTTKNGDGTVTMADGTRVDASLAGAYTNANKSLDEGITQAKANLTAAAAALQSDPAAMNAINTIMSKFDEQIKLMQAKNKVLLGAARVNAARSGMLQYAAQMNDNFMSEEQDAAAQRIADLITRESQAVLTAQTAYQKGDVAAFNAASAALSKAQNDKISSIGKLLDETDKIVKERQAQAKIDAAAIKSKLTTDVTTSTKIAAGMADSLKKSGITDPTQIKAYIEQMAEKNGISNPEILNSALVTAQATASKAELAAENTRNVINKREAAPGKKAVVAKGGTDGGFTYSADDIAQYTTLLNQGGKGPDGTSYEARGTDGFVDPNAYITAYQDWISKDNNGTPQGFIKKFPVVGNVNPSAYSQLPTAIVPKTKAASTGPKYVTTPAPAK